MSTSRKLIYGPDAGSKHRSAVIHFTFLILLSLVTTFFFQSDSRFQQASPDIMENARFENGGAGWSGNGKVTIDIAVTPAVVRFEANPNGMSLLTRNIGAVSGWRQLRFQGEFRSDGIQQNEKPWQAGGLIVRSFDKHGQRIRYWPYHLLHISGEQSWQTLVATFPIGDEIERLRLYIFNAGIDGSMEMRSLRVDALSERSWSLILKQILVGSWILFALRLLVVTVRASFFHDRYRWELRAAAALSIMILTGALMPVPQLRSGLEVVDAGLGHAWQNVAPSIIVTDLAKTVDDEANKSASPNDAAGSDDMSNAEQTPKNGDQQDPEDTPHITEADSEEAPPPPPTIGIKHVIDHGWAGFDAQQIGHMLSYMGLGFCLISLIFINGYLVAGATLLAAIASTEILQQFLITRSVEISDLTINTIGLALGASIWIFWRLTQRYITKAAGTL